jgi:CheY-like chemotaxis protein
VSLILAVEPDGGQAKAVRRAVRSLPNTHLVLVESRQAALAALGHELPDLILVSALLPPGDEAALTDYLRARPEAAHVEMITIPVLATSLQPAETKRRGFFGLIKGGDAKPHEIGTDPQLFADNIRMHLAQAREAYERNAAVRERQPARSQETATEDASPIADDASAQPSAGWDARPEHAAPAPESATWTAGQPYAPPAYPAQTYTPDSYVPQSYVPQSYVPQPLDRGTSDLPADAERWCLPATFKAAEPMLADRIAQLAEVDDRAIARTYGIEHDTVGGGLIIVSEPVPGARLSDLLTRATSRAMLPDLPAALFVMRRLLAISRRLFAATGIRYLSIAPDRVNITPRGEVIVLDAVLAAADIHGQADPQLDIAATARIGLSLILGRLIDAAAVHDWTPLLEEAADIAAIRAGDRFAGALRSWLERALGLEGSFDDAGEALAAFDALNETQEGGSVPLRRSLRAFLSDLALEGFDDVQVAVFEAERVRAARARQTAGRGARSRADAAPAAAQSFDTPTDTGPVFLAGSQTQALLDELLARPDERRFDFDLPEPPSEPELASATEEVAPTPTYDDRERAHEPPPPPPPRYQIEPAPPPPSVVKPPPPIEKPAAHAEKRTLLGLFRSLRGKHRDEAHAEPAQSQGILRLTSPPKDREVHDDVVQEMVQNARSLGEPIAQNEEVAPPYLPPQTYELPSAWNDSPIVNADASVPDTSDWETTTAPPAAQEWQEPDEPIQTPRAQWQEPEEPVQPPAVAWTTEVEQEDEPIAPRASTEWTTHEQEPAEPERVEWQREPPQWTTPEAPTSKPDAWQANVDPPEPLDWDVKPAALAPGEDDIWRSLEASSGAPDSRDDRGRTKPEGSSLLDAFRSLRGRRHAEEREPDVSPLPLAPMQDEAAADPEPTEWRPDTLDDQPRARLAEPIERATEPLEPRVIPAEPPPLPALPPLPPLPPPIEPQLIRLETPPLYVPLELPVVEPPPPKARPAPGPVTRKGKGVSRRWIRVAVAAVVVGTLAFAGREYFFGPAPPPPVEIAPSKPAATTGAGRGRASRPAAPAKGVGSLAVSTTPPGAEVTIDGKARGVTPLTIDNLASGTHAVVLTSGQGTVRRTVQIKANEQAILEESIFSGFLAVFAPFELQIVEGGRLIGTSESGQILVPPGSHELVLTNSALGFTQTRVVEVNPGRTTSINIKAPEGIVRIVGAPPEAFVFVDGISVSEPGELRVPIGVHEIVVKHPQLGTRKATVNVTLQSTVEVKVDFTQ